MEVPVEKMEAQLSLWMLKINNLATGIQKAGVRAGFDAVMHIDELKGLHAIAQSKLIAFRNAGASTRADLEGELKRAWNDLDAAMKTPVP